MFRIVNLQSCSNHQQNQCSTTKNKDVKQINKNSLKNEDISELIVNQYNY